MTTDHVLHEPAAAIPVWVALHALRFDMADAEFTHEGERCSFETLVPRAGLGQDSGLAAIGEIIHDLDIAEGKFARPRRRASARCCPGSAPPPESMPESLTGRPADRLPAAETGQ